MGVWNQQKGVTTDHVEDTHGLPTNPSNIDFSDTKEFLHGLSN